LAWLDRRALIAAGLGLPLAGVAPAKAEGRWQTLPAGLPWPVSGAAGAIWREEILIAGGMAGTAVLDRSAGYEVHRQTWLEGQRLPFGRHHAAMGTVIAERFASAGFPDLFIAGGYRASSAGAWTATKEVMLYDVTWRPMEPMPAYQSEAVAVGLYDRLHLVGGRAPKGQANGLRGDHAAVATHQVYDPDSDTWAAARPFPTAVSRACGGTIDLLFYMAGGLTVDGAPSAGLSVYDADIDRWKTLKPMPKAVAGAASAVLGGKLYVLGGATGAADNQTVTAECWSYDPKTDAWTSEPPMPTARQGLVAVALGGRILAMGGRLASGDPSEAIDAFMPAS
jgi:hypothetical protein